MSIKILGISAYYHDSAAALLIDGKIVAAAKKNGSHARNIMLIFRKMRSATALNMLG